MERQIRDYPIMARLSPTERRALESIQRAEALPIAQIVRRLIVRAAAELR
jgi:hypothetical protein